MSARNDARLWPRLLRGAGIHPSAIDAIALDRLEGESPTRVELATAASSRRLAVDYPAVPGLLSDLATRLGVTLPVNTLPAATLPVDEAAVRSVGIEASDRGAVLRIGLGAVVPRLPELGRLDEMLARAPVDRRLVATMIRLSSTGRSATELRFRPVHARNGWLGAWLGALSAADQHQDLRRFLAAAGELDADRLSVVVGVQEGRAGATLRTEIRGSTTYDDPVVARVAAVLGPAVSLAWGETAVGRGIQASWSLENDEAVSRQSPRRHTTAPRGASTLEQALQKGVDFLTASLGPDGAWRDYPTLAEGADAWTTAYVLHRLSTLPPASRPAEAVAKGIAWLLDNRGPDRAWGYRLATSNDDTDATSLAILALRRLGAPVPDEVGALLARCRRPDGGFATYPPDGEHHGGWVTSQADVTPVALVASRDAGVREAGRAWLRGEQRDDGTWPTYWWATSLYPTWGAVAVLRPDSPRSNDLLATLERYQPSGAFDGALQALLFDLLGAPGRAASRLTTLAGEQRDDGSWRGSALLRFTEPALHGLGDQIDAGKLYLDHHHVFTTSTVVGALAGHLYGDLELDAIARPDQPRNP
ncbi:MAG: prenyltransferase/squalene oxidase repeat-containing protein [Acidobacteriota bacterium]